MRSVSATASQIVASDTRSVYWVADLFYNGTRVQQDVPIVDPQLKWDASSQVAGSGSVTVVSSDPFGTGMTPVEMTDQFAPYGAELQVDVIVAAGQFSERIALGRFMIESVPQTVSIPFLFRGQFVYPGDAFKLELRDMLWRANRNKFPFPESPKSTSAWSEAGRLVNLPLLRNVTDGVVPSTVTYDDSRLDVLDTIFDTMQAWPQLTSNGVLTARTYAWPAVVDTVLAPEVISNSLRSDNVYNRVIVEGKGPNGEVVRSVKDLTDGPVRAVNPDGSPTPYGVVPYFYSSDFVTTQAQADATALTLLSRVSVQRGITRTFKEPFNPLRELGDVLMLNGEKVRITETSFAGAETSNTVEVQE